MITPATAPATERAGPDEQPILLFDGVCNLCSGLARFIISRDRAPGRFRFASLQSETGQRLLREFSLPGDDLNTFVMIDRVRNVAHVRSTAALHVLRRLGFPWSLLYVCIVVPRPLRDLVYRVVAQNRYRWFGRRDHCMLPAPEIQDRFLA